LLIQQAIAAAWWLWRRWATMGTGQPDQLPGRTAGVVAVGATDELDRRAFRHSDRTSSWSRGGEHPQHVPTYPTSLASTTLYEAWPGTSMATPFVAATVA
jgi:hypothetical protein